MIKMLMLVEVEGAIANIYDKIVYPSSIHIFTRVCSPKRKSIN